MNINRKKFKKMKNILSILAFLIVFVLSTSVVLAEGERGSRGEPGDPGGDPTGETPVGGDAPVGSGLLILIGLGAAYGGKKVYDIKKEELES